MYPSVRELLEFINKCTSPWHTVNASAEYLEQNGYQELQLSDTWNLAENTSYYCRVFGSTLIAFHIGNNFTKQYGAADTTAPRLRIAAAHTDFPGFRIKPSASMLKEGYGILNVESYGGLILSTWQDRPLSIAGNIVLKGENPFTPQVQLVDFCRPLMTIPSLAIHMNRKVNDGVALNKQTQMLPISSILGKDADNHYMIEFIAHELGCQAEDILSYELNLYPYEAGCQLGLAGELISSPRLDNITSVLACLHGITAANTTESTGLQLIALFDNEEIGSRTKQGADSGVLYQLLQRIYCKFGLEQEHLLQDIASGFMLSVDVAHGVHPDYTEKADPTNKPILNSGVVLKEAASQAYAGDAQAIAIIRQLCLENNIPSQQFVNRSDIPGGSTLGSIASSLIPIRTMDIGVPILAMHSARETMGSSDQDALNRLLKGFFK